MKMYTIEWIYFSKGDPMRYKIHISLPKLGIVETQIIDCNSYDEACHLARDAAWDLYMTHEGASEDLPSYNDLLEKYHGEWFDLIDSEFERAIDDLYVRTIQDNIEYYIGEEE